MSVSGRARQLTWMLAKGGCSRSHEVWGEQVPLSWEQAHGKGYMEDEGSKVMRRKKIIRKIQRRKMGGSDHVVVILITLTMIIVKFIGSTCSSWSLDWLVPRDNEADEEKSICSFRGLKSDYTKCLKIHERLENYTCFCCSNKFIYSVQVSCEKNRSKWTQVVWYWADLLWETFSELWQALVSRYFSQPVAHSCRMATTLKVLCILQQELLHHLKCSGRFGTNKISWQ